MRANSSKRHPGCPETAISAMSQAHDSASAGVGDERGRGMPRPYAVTRSDRATVRLSQACRPNRAAEYSRSDASVRP